MTHSKVWIIKCREWLSDGSKGWHWKHYFPPTSDYDPDEIFDDWGGEDWIRSSRSKKYLREEVASGDLAVCYQSDDSEYGRAIIGFARFVSDGKEEEPGSGEYNCFDLCAPNEAFLLRRPLRIEDLHATGCRPECLGPGTQGTIFPVSSVEFEGIVAAIAKSSPKQETRLRRWLAAGSPTDAAEALKGGPEELPRTPIWGGKLLERDQSGPSVLLRPVTDENAEPLFDPGYNDGFEPAPRLRQLLVAVYAQGQAVRSRREILDAFGYKKLGSTVTETVSRCLKERGVQMSPRLDKVGIDDDITLKRVDQHFEPARLGTVLCGELSRLAAGRARVRYRDLLLFCGFARDGESARQHIGKVFRSGYKDIHPSLGTAGSADWIYLSVPTPSDQAKGGRGTTVKPAPKVSRTQAEQRADAGLEGKHSRWLTDSQRELTVRFIEGRNTFGVMPTGSGKSLCFQLAAECLQDQGLTLVVSPLIALMADQNKKSPPGVTFLNSTVSPEENRERRKCLWEGGCRLLYVTPEQLGSESLLRTLTDGGKRVIRTAIDEAHCVSEWGHSFRVEYLLLRDALVRLGSPPVLLLTATAPPDVRWDVVNQLGIDLNPGKSEDLVIDHYRREELEPGVQRVRGSRSKYRELQRFVHAQGKGSRGIVYTRFATAQDCENCHEIARWLEGKGLGPVAVYHGQLPTNAKGEQQDKFTQGEARIIVATNAFGLGIDLPKIDWIVHFYMPPSLLDYYQEIGRGGRGMAVHDGDRCQCLVLYDPDDRELVEGLVQGNVAGADKIATRLRQLIEGKGKQHGLRGPHEVLFDDARQVLLLPFRPMTTQYTVRIAHMLALQDIGVVERLPNNLFHGNNVYAQFAVKRGDLTATDQRKLENRQEGRRQTLRERLDGMQRFCESPDNDARWDILDREFSA